MRITKIERLLDLDRVPRLRGALYRLGLGALCQLEEALDAELRAQSEAIRTRPATMAGSAPAHTD